MKILSFSKASLSGAWLCKTHCQDMTALFKTKVLFIFLFFASINQTIWDIRSMSETQFGYAFYSQFYLLKCEANILRATSTTKKNCKNSDKHCHWSNKQIAPPPNSHHWLSYCCYVRLVRIKQLAQSQCLHGK